MFLSLITFSNDKGEEDMKHYALIKVPSTTVLIELN